jgi:major vault protein
MVILGLRQYCIIENPVLRNEKGEIKLDKHDQVIVQHGEIEYRFNNLYPEPFPLYPKEVLQKEPTSLTTVRNG